MKLTGILGSGSGRLGSSVFSVNHGVQVVRQYQPKVNDAKSAAQTAVRAKFKLLSQLSEILAPSMGFARIGLVSPRNLFMRANYPTTEFNTQGMKAQIPMLSVVLTDSPIGMSPLAVTRDGSTVTMTTQGPNVDFDAFVYIAITSGEDVRMRNVANGIVTEKTGGKFTASVTFDVGVGGYVYAYGIRYGGDSKINAKYESIISQPPNGVVNVIEQLLAAGASVTETRSAVVPATATSQNAKVKN